MHTHRTFRLVVVAATAVVTCAASGQTVIYVDAAAEPDGEGGSWANALNEIQDALALAASMPGDDVQIWIAAGVYRPGGPEDGPEATFNLISGVALYGGFKGGERSLDERDWELNQTVLNGSPASTKESCTPFTNVLTGHSIFDVRLDGLVITGGSAWTWPDSMSGGGLVLESSTLEIANVLFLNNDAEIGGAIHAVDSDLIFENVQFESNFAFDAGAMRLVGGSLQMYDCAFVDQSALEVGGAFWATDALIVAEGTAFRDNAAPGNGFSGAAALYNSDVTFINCLFTGNHAHGPSTLWVDGSLTLDGCTFDQNGTGGYTVEGSGALHVLNSDFTDNAATPIFWSGGSNDVALIGSTFVNNGCSGSKCGVGGVQIGAAAIEIDESTFHGNSSPWGGNVVIGATHALIRNSHITAGSALDVVGGLEFGGGSLTVVNTLIASNGGGVAITGSANATFVNCTIADNLGVSLDWAGGLSVDASAHAQVRNSILWGNAEGDESAQISGPADVSNSILQGLDMHTGHGNLGADPMFIDDDGRLAPNSPAIDAGDNDAFLALDIELVDLDGEPRIVDGDDDGVAAIDIGAFEVQDTVQHIPGDLDGDGSVGVSDLLIVLGAWGECADCAPGGESGACPADMDNDCAVGVSDLLVILAAWSA